MLWLAALMLVSFALLAVGTIGGMTAMGTPVDLAIEAAVFEVVVGATIVKLMYESAKRQ